MHEKRRGVQGLIGGADLRYLWLAACDAGSNSTRKQGDRCADSYWGGPEKSDHLSAMTRSGGGR
jgi:hypothetical protein